MDRLDGELMELLDEIKFDFEAIDGCGSVTENGKYIPNSQVALNLAKNSLRVSEILYKFESEEE